MVSLRDFEPLCLAELYYIHVLCIVVFFVVFLI